MKTNSFVMEISKENIINNVNFLKKKYKKSILPVVKANAYGHGIKVITKT
ncbi:MAG: alanine racemase, partial [Cetobacterium sp.]